VKQFQNEFSLAIQNQLKEETHIYIVEVLCDLSFVNEHRIRAESIKVNAILNQQKQLLVIDTEEGNFEGIAEDMTKNFFKICCAILNYRPKQRDINPLPDPDLREILDKIQLKNRDTLILDQFNAIKELCHRKAFSLSDRQIS
jgi:hypothetical protein